MNGNWLSSFFKLTSAVWGWCLSHQTWADAHLPTIICPVGFDSKSFGKGIASSLVPMQPPVPVTLMCCYSKNNINEMWRDGEDWAHAASRTFGLCVLPACIFISALHLLPVTKQLKDFAGQLSLPLIPSSTPGDFMLQAQTIISSFFFFFFLMHDRFILKVHTAIW